MTSFFDTEIDRIFKKMSESFFDANDIIEEFNGNSNSGPIFYGYTMTIGPDGKPSVQEFGNKNQIVSLFLMPEKQLLIQL